MSVGVCHGGPYYGTRTYDILFVVSSILLQKVQRDTRSNLYMIFVKYASIFISTRTYSFPAELSTFYSHYEFISSAGCSAV